MDTHCQCKHSLTHSYVCSHLGGRVNGATADVHEPISEWQWEALIRRLANRSVASSGTVPAGRAGPDGGLQCVLLVYLTVRKVCTVKKIMVV